MVWTRLVDDSSGKPYYYDDENEITQWEFPEDVLNKALADCGWSKAMTDDNEVYFYSEAGGESSWELPEGVVEAIKIILGNDNINVEEILNIEVAAHDATATEKRVDAKTSEEEAPNDAEILDDIKEPSKSDVAIKDSSNINDIVGLDSLISKTSHSEQTTTETPESKFRAMLTDFKVNESWKFVDLIKSCSNDDRYWCVIDPLAREQLFIDYLKELVDKEYNEERMKLKLQFYEILQKYNIKYFTRWVTFEKQLVNEDLYQKLSPKVRAEFFDDYVHKLRKEKEIANKETKSGKLRLLENYLNEKVEITSEFSKTLVQIEKDKTFNELSKGDILNVFEKVMQLKEDEEKELIQEEKKKNYRCDRIARDHFKNKLNENIASGKLKSNSKTKWVDFLTAMKDEKEFQELCGHNGSSPIDYYWDLIFNETMKILNEKPFFEQILVNTNYKIEHMSRDMFMKLMKSKSKLPEEDLDTLYTMMSETTKLNVAQKRPFVESHEYSNEPEKRSRYR